MLRWVVLALSVSSAVFFLIRQRYKVKWFRIFTETKITSTGEVYNYYGERLNKIEDEGSLHEIRKKQCSRYLVLELLILLICPLPYGDWTVTATYYLRKPGKPKGNEEI